MTQRNARVLVVGAGIAGPTLAYWLRQYAFTPTLVERAPTPRCGDYMIDFWGLGYDVAERMGVLLRLQLDDYHIEEVRIVDGQGKRVAGFDAEVFRTALNNRFLSLPRGDLARLLYDRVAGTIETLFSETITAVAEDSGGLTVAFDHASPRRFDLVVGADGLHSAVRAHAFGEHASFERYLGYYTAAFSASDYPHRDEGVYVCYSVLGGQIARYALRGGRSAFLFIFAQENPLPLSRNDVAAQKDILHERFRGRGWECDEILAAMDVADDLYFDAVSQTRMPRWSHGRVALIGDAAYCPSLLAGDGAALAMAGAFVLANALYRAAGDHQIAFTEYERQLKPFIERKQRAATRLGWWFAPRTRLGIWLRNQTTKVLDLPVVASRIAARTFGDRFELPN